MNSSPNPIKYPEPIVEPYLETTNNFPYTEIFYTMGNWLLTVQKAHGFLAPEMMEGQCPYGFGKAAP